MHKIVHKYILCLADNSGYQASCENTDHEGTYHTAQM